MEKINDFEYDYLEYYFDMETKKSPDPHEQTLLSIASFYLKHHDRPHSWETVEKNLEAGKNRGDAEYIYYYALYMYEPDDVLFAELVEESANKGFSIAQSEMGLIKCADKKVTPEALAWYRKAAEGGDAYGQREYGKYLLECCIEKSSAECEWILSKGKTMEDLNFALEWIRKAAAGGDTSALCRLGELYLDGIVGCVKKNELKAYKYYHEASVSDDYMGSLTCGIIHEEGIGIPIDYSRARYYYMKAANDFGGISDSPNPEVSFRLGRLIYNGLGGNTDKEKGERLMRYAVGEYWNVDWDDDASIMELMRLWKIKKIIKDTNLYTYGLPGGRCD